MRTNVTTPGGFFVGLGGIVAFCVVSSLVYLWVKNPAPNSDLRPQQAALGLAAAPDAPHDQVKKKKEETDVLLEAAAAKYNGGVKPDIDRLPELRGVVRYREAQKSASTAEAALNAPSKEQGKTVIAAAIEEVAKEIAGKEAAPSKIALAEPPPPETKDPTVAPLPNFTGGGVRTMHFVNPTAPAPGAAPTPAPGAAPATPPTQAPAPAPAAPQANVSLEAAAPIAAVAPSRPPLLNWSASK